LVIISPNLNEPIAKTKLIARNDQTLFINTIICFALNYGRYGYNLITALLGLMAENKIISNESDCYP